MSNQINDFITTLNGISGSFCSYAGSMFVQSGILIVLLLFVDFLIRRRVRATLRYWIWMLVFVKLVLPPSLSLPTGIGYWQGEILPAAPLVLEQASRVIADEPAGPLVPGDTLLRVEAPQAQLSQTNHEPVDSITTALSTLNSLTWQAAVFVLWLAGVLVLSTLLIQRMLHVRRLISRSKPEENSFSEMLNLCREQVGVRGPIELRVSNSVSSPAVCGLFKPVILIQEALIEKLSQDKLRAVLVHELCHIKRGDLWINSAQTILQIIYFYNPLVWLVNILVRRIREQAVDEMVLVALGAEARCYSNTLIDIAEMAFSRPALSQRLVGVVESKKALAIRIRHILSRPIPKTAKLGIFGLLIIIAVAATLLPMAKGQSDQLRLFDDDLLIRLESVDNEFSATLSNGVTVELVGLKDARANENNVWWSPDGKILSEPAHKVNLRPYAPVDNSFNINDTFEFEFVFRFSKHPKVLKVDFETNGSKNDHITNYRHTLVEIDNKSELHSENVIFPVRLWLNSAEPNYVNVRVGAAFENRPAYTDKDYEWIEFKNVALNPTANSNVKPLYISESAKVDIAINNEDLRVTKLSEGLFEAVITLRNKGSVPIPQFRVNFHAGDPDKGGRLLSAQAAGPIQPGESWAEYNPGLRLEPGENTISVIVDPDNKVDESDETNNKVSQNVTTLVSESEKVVNVGAIQKVSLAGDDILQIEAREAKSFNFPFYLFIPKGIDKGKPVYMLVETNNTGTASDDFEVHRARAFKLAEDSYAAQMARQLGIPLLVPTFPRPRTNWWAYTHALDIDTLEITEGKLKRIDLQLTAMIKYAQELLRTNGFKINDKVFMHGFSASAKFCNRYSFLHPEMVKAVAAGGVNGLPTLPVRQWNGCELPFPIGIAGIEKYIDGPFNEEAFSKVAHYIYMGSLDRNDTLPSRDAWREDEAEIIKKVLAEKMMPDRWELTQKIYSGQKLNAQLVTYSGVTHAIKKEMQDDVINFFKANSGENYVRITPHEYPAVTAEESSPKHETGSAQIDITPAAFDIRFDEDRGVYNLRVDIPNKGSLTIPEMRLRFYRGDPGNNLDEAGKVNSGSHGAGPIEPGRVWGESTRPFYLRDGQYEFNVILDYDNSISETDENNNQATLKVKIENGQIADKSVICPSNSKGRKLDTQVGTGGGTAVPQKASNSLPNIFIMSPLHSTSDIYDKVVSLSRDWVWNRTGRPHGRKFYDEIFDGTHNRSVNDVLVMVFSLDREERIPVEYEDLLPKPWAEIEAELKQGRTVELLGKARELNVILIAAPKMELLEDAIARSKFLTNPKSFLMVSERGCDIGIEDFKINFDPDRLVYYVVASICNYGKVTSPQLVVCFCRDVPGQAKPMIHGAGPIEPGKVWNERSSDFGLKEGVNEISVVLDPADLVEELNESNNSALLRVDVKDGRFVRSERLLR